MVREEPYPDLTCEWYRSESGGTRKGAHTGVARLSSARVVRCWVKSRNERNPRGLLYLSDPTAERNSEEGGDEVKSAWPLCLGLHARYNRRSQRVATTQVEANPLKPASVQIEGCNPPS
jgi:hypothetical protein